MLTEVSMVTAFEVEQLRHSAEANGVDTATSSILAWSCFKLIFRQQTDLSQWGRTFST